MIAGVLLSTCVALPACGGGDKKQPVAPAAAAADKPAPPPAETEEDRERTRQAAAHQIVPEGSNCLPESLKEQSAPRLELAAVGGEAIICAIDTERERLLGPVACWKVDLASGGVEYQKAAPMPGRGLSVKLHNGCARTYCLPKAAAAGAKLAHLVWSPDAAKVAVSAGDEIHIFDATTKERSSHFSVRGDQGVAGDLTRLSWVGDTIFVEASDGGSGGGVWMFKAADGAPGGALESIGKAAKPLTTRGGSFVVLDENRVAVAEQGFSSIVSFEVDSGKRAKLVRKLPKSPCKGDEATAYWSDAPDKLSPKCKDHMTKHFSHFIGADAVAGKKSMLVLLREARLGELAVLDSKTLAETRPPIRLAWCEAAGGAPAGEK